MNSNSTPRRAVDHDIIQALHTAKHTPEPNNRLRAYLNAWARERSEFMAGRSIHPETAMLIKEHLSGKHLEVPKPKMGRKKDTVAKFALELVKAQYLRAVRLETPHGKKTQAFADACEEVGLSKRAAGYAIADHKELEREIGLKVPTLANARGALERVRKSGKYHTTD
jgi:hypothetical protein